MVRIHAGIDRDRLCVDQEIARVQQMAEELRVKKSVLLVAGEQVGMEGFVRFGFGGDPAHLQKALGRIDEGLGETRAASAR